jgi:hypothetical protein
MASDAILQFVTNWRTIELSRQNPRRGLTALLMERSQRAMERCSFRARFSMAGRRAEAERLAWCSTGSVNPRSPGRHFDRWLPGSKQSWSNHMTDKDSPEGKDEFALISDLESDIADARSLLMALVDLSTCHIDDLPRRVRGLRALSVASDDVIAQAERSVAALYALYLQREPAQGKVEGVA